MKEYWGLPEHLTSLYYTPSYLNFSHDVQRRHSMLYAGYMGEMTAFFETTLTYYVKRCAQLQQTSKALTKKLNQWIEEEARHTRMFRQLNRILLPEYYGESNHYFIEVSSVNRFALAILLHYPVHFPLFIWLMLLQEERSLYYTSEILSSEFPIDPRIVNAYRVHTHDEFNHITLDQDLLTLLWDNCALWKRQYNSKLLVRLIITFFSAPRQSGLKVVRTLLQEYPDLSHRWPEVRRELLALSDNRQFLSTIYSHHTNPKTFERLLQYPELAILTEALPGLQISLIEKAA